MRSRPQQITGLLALFNMLNKALAANETQQYLDHYYGDKYYLTDPKGEFLYRFGIRDSLYSPCNMSLFQYLNVFESQCGAVIVKDAEKTFRMGYAAYCKEFCPGPMNTMAASLEFARDASYNITTTFENCVIPILENALGTSYSYCNRFVHITDINDLLIIIPCLLLSLAILGYIILDIYEWPNLLKFITPTHTLEEIALINLASKSPEENDSLLLSLDLDETAELTFSERLSKIKYKGIIPEDFQDPYSNAILNDPIRVSTGIHYDRSNLKMMFALESNPTTLLCLKTGNHISITDLKQSTNEILQEQLDEFVQDKEKQHKNRLKHSLTNYGALLTTRPTMTAEWLHEEKTNHSINPGPQ